MSRQASTELVTVPAFVTTVELSGSDERIGGNINIKIEGDTPMKGPTSVVSRETGKHHV